MSQHGKLLLENACRGVLLEHLRKRIHILLLYSSVLYRELKKRDVLTRTFLGASEAIVNSREGPAVKG